MSAVLSHWLQEMSCIGIPASCLVVKVCRSGKLCLMQLQGQQAMAWACKTQVEDHGRCLLCTQVAPGQHCQFTHVMRGIQHQSCQRLSGLSTSHLELCGAGRYSLSPGLRLLV